MSIRLYPVNDVQFLLHSGPDYISQHLREGKSWEPLLLDIIGLFLRKIERPIFVDIGANLGAVSVPVGKMIQKNASNRGGGEVHSIEAQRNVYYQLCGNIFANDLSQHCFAYHTAIGNTTGSLKIPFLSLKDTGNVGALSLDEFIRQEQGWKNEEFTTYENVPLTTLDELNLPAASIVKIDVEGMELEVISGGLMWLERSGFPPILFEVWDDTMKNQIPKREALLDLLKQVGYEYAICGELCIAQHYKNQYLQFIYNENNQLDKVSLLP
ncbi:FkbM family methyltransferase [Mannheimia bovis]|uniref:FkbM family methyltransferase n=1 Tax=Mannheimia indoligenes TaxID=3103145 RepID=A0ABU7ZDQ0_9PAST|nr:FkbM family methyltransferase [Mannheimia bovis]WHP46542.1 FkbM family methyltransferase [Mannheimia bovis]